MYSGYHKFESLVDGHVEIEKYEYHHVLLVLEKLYPGYGLIMEDDDKPIKVVVNGKIIGVINYIDD